MELETVSNSRLASMLGLDSRCSPLALYHRMRGEVPDIQDNEAMRQGRYYEEATARLCCDDRGMRLLTEGAQETVSEGRFSGHRDYAAIDEHGKLVTLEVKNLMFADVGEDGWGDPETDQVPTPYLIQEMGYIHTHKGKQLVQTTGDIGMLPADLQELRFADYGYIAARLRSGVHRFKIPLDPEVIAKLDFEMEVFLARVRDGVPPLPQDESDARNRWAVADDKFIEADETLLEAMRNQILIKRQVKELEKQLSANNLLILGYAQDAERIESGGRVVATLKANRSFDGKACLDAHPELSTDYLKIDTTKLRNEQPTLYELFKRRPENAVDQTRPIKLKEKALMPEVAK
tara:strand:- start:99 stop:1142 length:1044 start_codon:yes stop_codon:yes gene_type:complete